jgi:hypothetical protein
MKSTISLTLLACLAARLAAAGLDGATEARPQSGDAAWLPVTQLAAGENVRVVLGGPITYQGTFRTADGESITIAVAGHDQRLSRARIRQVSVARGTHRRRNVLIGLAIGGAASAVAVGVHCRGAASSCKEVAPVYLYPLAGAGAGIGALLPAGRAWQEIYAN